MMAYMGSHASQHQLLPSARGVGHDKDCCSIKCLQSSQLTSIVVTRTRTGYVTRLLLEAGLRQHCRQALAPLPATDLLDLLDGHAAGLLLTSFATLSGMLYTSLLHGSESFTAVPETKAAYVSEIV